MKFLFKPCFLLLIFFTANLAKAQDPIVINKTDSEIYVQFSTSQDFTTFGYAKADKTSTKIICFSSMTADVDGNPHKCKLGAHYTSDEFTISYLGTEGDWVKAEAKVNGEGMVFYFEKSALVFED